MAFDQKGVSVFCVAMGKDGQWEVTEDGFEKPLATFQSQTDAETYARDLAQTKPGSTVKMTGDATAALLRA